jgi:hypothetical protein
MFENCGDVSDVKREYKRLIFKVHPDVHPASEFAHWNEQCRILNEQYHAALNAHDNEVSVGTDGKEHTYRYSYSTESDLCAVIDALIKAHLSAHIAVNIVGIYIWVENTQREDREDQTKIKSAGLFWHSKRNAWYWKPAYYRTHYNAAATLDDLKYIYGAARVETDESRAIA